MTDDDDRHDEEKKEKRPQPVERTGWERIVFELGDEEETAE